MTVIERLVIIVKAPPDRFDIDQIIMIRDAYDLETVAVPEPHGANESARLR